jgi:hypothetical protein
VSLDNYRRQLSALNFASSSVQTVPVWIDVSVPAIRRGFYKAHAGRSPALRLLRAFGRLTEVKPPRPGQPPEGEGR